jgi:hypothetical protein
VQNLRAAEWALSKGKRLFTLGVRQQDKEITVADRSQLPAPPFRVVLISIIHGDESITTADLERIRPLRELRIFEAANSQIDDAGLEILRTLPHLVVINVRGSRITDAGLRAVGQMTTLTKLVICETNVTDAGIEHVLACRKLQAVWLSGPKVTSAGVRKLLQLPELTELTCTHISWSRDNFDAFLTSGSRLEGLAITVSGDDDVGALVKLPKLLRINLEGANMTDRSVELVASNTRLKQVTFVDNQHITDQGIAHLQKMPQLELLDLSACTGITDVAVAHLVGLKQLTELNLIATKVGHASVPSLKQMTSLRQLNLHGTQMTAADIAELRAALPNCQILWDEPKGK